MTQDNPFAKLGALDQKLYQETTPKPHVEEVEKRVEKDPKEKENASLLVNQQTSKLIKKKTSKSVNQETSKEINQQTNKLASSQYNLQPLSTKEKKKYGTYLREDSISKIQFHAIQTERKDYEVLQEAVDFYFKYKKK